MATTPDSFTRRGADDLAAKIVAYWRERGHSNVRAERYQLDGHEGLYGVRSNLVNGRPVDVLGRYE